MTKFYSVISNVNEVMPY